MAHDSSNAIALSQITLIGADASGGGDDYLEDGVRSSSGGGATSLNVGDLQKNLRRFVDQAGFLISGAADAAVASANGFEIDSFTISAAIESSGQIGLLGTGASLGASGSIELVFTRKQDSPT